MYNKYEGAKQCHNFNGFKITRENILQSVAEEHGQHF